MIPSPITINHQSQFPVVTLSFNLAPGASLGAAVEHIKQVTQGTGHAGQHRTQLPGNGPRV